MRRSSRFALGIVALTTLWMLSGTFMREEEKIAESNTKLFTVETLTLTAEPTDRVLRLQGFIEPIRSVQLKAETKGRIKTSNLRDGMPIQKGDVLVELAMDDRQARLAEAKATLTLRQQQWTAAERLGEEGFQSRTRVAEARANLEAARAEVARIELDIQHTKIRAPFDGVVDRRMMDEGAFVDIGNEVARVIDIDPLLVVINVPQQQALQVNPGLTATVEIKDGQRFKGEVQAVSAQADPVTRTYRVEVTMPNPKLLRLAGASATVSLPLENVNAHKVSPAAMTLADDGTVGVKIVEGENTVAFYPVDMVRPDSDGVWVSGLPVEARVIVTGQGYVRVGEQVNVRETGDLPPIPQTPQAVPADAAVAAEPQAE